MLICRKDMDICNKYGCKHEAHEGFVVCGKHLGWGQSNRNSNRSMCTKHTDKYACNGFTVCGYCMGYGPSCLEA